MGNIMDKSALKLVDFSRKARVNGALPAFPYGLGACGVHEIAPRSHADGLAASGFAVAGGLRQAGPGAIVWVGGQAERRETGRLAGFGLARFGIDPTRLVVVQARKSRKALWAVEEAMGSPAVALVVAELPAVDFTASRRLALASEARGMPVILLLGFRCEGASAAAARWRVSARSSAPNRWDRRAPGHPRWQAVLERSRAVPGMSGRAYDLEFDHEALSLHMVSGLAAGASRPPAPDKDETWRDTG